MTRTEPRLE